MPQWCLCSCLLVWWRFLWWLVQQAIWEVLTSLSHMVPCVGPVLSILCLVCPVGRVFVHVCLTQFYVPYIGGESGYERASLCWIMLVWLFLSSVCLWSQSFPMCSLCSNCYIGFCLFLSFLWFPCCICWVHVDLVLVVLCGVC